MKKFVLQNVYSFIIVDGNVYRLYREVNYT